MKARLFVAICLITMSVCGMGNIALGQNEITESTTGSLYITSKTLQLGSGGMYMTWETFAVILSDTGQGLFHGATVRSIGTSLIGKESWDGEGYSIYTLKDGEKVFARVKQGGKITKPPVPGNGTMTFIGGTGKYSGIQGGTEYVQYSLRPAAEGIAQGYNKSKVTYKLP